MSEAVKILLMIAVAVATFLSKSLYTAKARKFALIKNWAKEEGLKKPDTAILEDIGNYWRTKRDSLPDVETVDDITWNDLSMDAVYREIDATVSVTGSECLCAALRYIASTIHAARAIVNT